MPNSYSVGATATPIGTDAPCFDCVSHRAGRRCIWIRATGEVDLMTAPRLVQALDEAQTKARVVVLDLQGVTFMDSSGVHALVDAARYARLATHRLVRGWQVRQRLVVIRTPRAIQDLLDLTGTGREIDSHGDGVMTGEPQIMVLPDAGEMIFHDRRTPLLAFEEQHGNVHSGWVLYHAGSRDGVAGHFVGGELGDIAGALSSSREWLRRKVIDPAATPALI